MAHPTTPPDLEAFFFRRKMNTGVSDVSEKKTLRSDYGTRKLCAAPRAPEHNNTRFCERLFDGAHRKPLRPRRSPGKDTPEVTVSSFLAAIRCDKQRNPAPSHLPAAAAAAAIAASHISDLPYSPHSLTPHWVMPPPAHRPSAPPSGSGQGPRPPRTVRPSTAVQLLQSNSMPCACWHIGTYKSRA